MEDFDLRSTAVERASTHGPSGSSENVSSVQRETFDIEDVAWSNGIYSNYIATAASNGKIMLYDMKRPEVEVARLHEHYRQVHKVDFNPIEGQFLLSGSQDGTVRLWDLRVFRQNMMVCSSTTFPGRSDGVRHVKWNPVDRWTFAFGTDNGTIQRWDTRKARAPVLTISAHGSICNSVDWHPDGKHLVSAGKDREVKVWDMSMEGLRKRKPAHQLRTPREVQNVRWRPACLSPDPQDPSNTIRQCTHLATSYRNTPIVHVWDLRRPFMPFREIHHRQNTGTTDMLWHSKDLLWTVGPEGDFTQTDIHYAPKVLDRRCLQTVASSPLGEMAFFTSARPPRSGQGGPLHPGSLEARAASRIDKNGRSPGDGSFEEHFLTATFRKKHSTVPVGAKPVRPVAVPNVPTEDSKEKLVTDLNVTMREYDGFRPYQLSQRGVLPGFLPSSTSTYLAWKYKTEPFGQPAGVEPWKLPTITSISGVKEIFERNGTNAQRSGLYREAQTWRIFGATLDREFKVRAEFNRKLRLSKPSGDQSSLRTARNSTPHMSLKDSSRSIKGTESTSNVQTPLTRPADHTASHPPQDFSTAQHELESELQLLPPLQMSSDSKTENNSLEGQASTVYLNAKGKIPVSGWNSSSVKEQTEKLALISQWKAQPKTPFSLDQQLESSRSVISRPSFNQRISEEDMIFPAGSSDSHHNLPIKEDSFASEIYQDNVAGSRKVSTLQKSSSFLSEVSADSSLSDQDDSQEEIFAFGSSASDNASSAPDTNQERQEMPQSYDNLTGESTSSSSAGHPSALENNEVDGHVEQRGRHSHTESLGEKTSRSMSSPTMRLKHPAEGASDTQVRSEASQDKQDSIDKTMTSSAPALIETSSERDNTNQEEYIISDYLIPLPPNVASSPLPFGGLEMFQRLLAWYTAHDDLQTASHLLLLGLPLFAPVGFAPPNDDFLASHEVLVASYHEHYVNAISLPPELASEIISTRLAPLEALDMSPAWVEAILSTYHQRLLSLDLHTPAVALRRLAYPQFPGVYEQGLQDVQIGLVCTDCRSPINNPRTKTRCETCKGAQTPCPICWSPESPYDMPARKRWKNAKAGEPGGPGTAHAGSDDFGETASQPGAYHGTPLWASCLVCGHAGHTACLFKWFADVDAHGACPTTGCMCDCTVGAYRDARLAGVELEERLMNAKKPLRPNDTSPAGERKPLNHVKSVLRRTGSMNAHNEGSRGVQHGS